MRAKPPITFAKVQALDNIVIQREAPVSLRRVTGVEAPMVLPATAETCSGGLNRPFSPVLNDFGKSAKAGAKRQTQ